jgi:hypothetical protein
MKSEEKESTLTNNSLLVSHDKSMEQFSTELTDAVNDVTMLETEAEWVGWCSSINLNLYSGGVQFESQPDTCYCWQRFCMVFLSPLPPPGKFHDTISIRSWLFHSKSFTCHHTIQQYILSSQWQHRKPTRERNIAAGCGGVGSTTCTRFDMISLQLKFIIRNEKEYILSCDKCDYRLGLDWWLSSSGRW